MRPFVRIAAQWRVRRIRTLWLWDVKAARRAVQRAAGLGGKVYCLKSAARSPVGQSSPGGARTRRLVRRSSQSPALPLPYVLLDSPQREANPPPTRADSE